MFGLVLQSPPLLHLHSLDLQDLAQEGEEHEIVMYIRNNCYYFSNRNCITYLGFYKWIYAGIRIKRLD
jgi:hypothetical protein